MNSSTAHKLEIARTAVALALARSAPSAKSVTLYGPNGQAITPDSYYSYRRLAAQRKGSLKNWIPQRLYSRHQEAIDRSEIVARSIDLTNNDPHAAGIVDTFASTIAGSGLRPIPTLDDVLLNLDKEKIRQLQKQQRAIYHRWYPKADATKRLSFGAIQYLCIRNFVEYGEYIILLYMIDDPSRPYSLACHVINPMRLRTPVDLISDSRIKDGVELGDHGEPIAYWIKLSAQNRMLPDTKENFRRIPATAGHRLNVIHRFIPQEPEQVRGIPIMAPSMKFFRNLNEYLNSELSANMIASALALFIEVDSNPYDIAVNMATFTEPKKGYGGRNNDERYQAIAEGTIVYGDRGEKPHLLTPNRPGNTFDPFTKIIKKAIAMGINIPYPVAFKDVEGVNFAGFRSAMLDAWRVFTMYRTWLGEDTCQPIYTMLMEEAFLRGEIDFDDFYLQMEDVTRCDWRGSPKGDIEPIKAVQADVLAIQNNIKTRAEAIAERGGDLRGTFMQLAEEQELMKELGLDEEKVTSAVADEWTKKENDGAVDDMQGAGDEGM